MKPRRRAKILDMAQLDRLLRHAAATSQDPLRDYVVLLLSFKAGLRAQEIAGLDWEDVLDASGNLASSFEVPSDIAKRGRARRVPMHPSLHASLEALRGQLGPKFTRPQDPVVRALYSHGLEQRVSPNALQRYLSRLASQAGLHGVSSHSGRRTFVTAAVRAAASVGCTLFDVQRIVGHADASTTADYVESSDAWDELVKRV